MNTRTTVASSLLHRVLAASACSVLLAGCGGGGSHASLPAAIPGSALGTSAVGSAATFRFSFPKPSATSARRRSPTYLSQGTQSISITVTDTKNHGTSSDIFATVPAALKTQQNFNLSSVSVSSPNAPNTCGSDPNHPLNTLCIVVFQLPVGDNTLTINAHDAQNGGGNLLSQQITTVWTQQGVGNTYSISLDANTAIVNVLGSQPCQAGAVIDSTYGSVGTSTVTLNVQYVDLAGKTIVDPGKPSLLILDSTSNTYKASGTISGTGGHADFTTNSSAQSFTLSPSSSTVTGVNVSVKAVPASPSDGLSQAGVTKSFTFSTGPAPGSGFLAAVESHGDLTGQVDLFTVTLVNNGSDHINPYVTSGGGTTLARTASANETGHFDVDNPEGLQFDTNGDLLVANGGSTTGGDFGNLACVPAGSIATGLANATTNSTNVDLGSPRNPIAYLTDGTAVLANNPTNAPVQSPAFLLAGNYVYSSARTYSAPGYGAYAVLALPTGTSPYEDGSYAVALTNGTDNQNVPATGLSKVTIVQPNGSTTDLTDTSGINLPFSLAWDRSSKQLVVANQSSHTLNVAWFTLNPFAKIKSINTNLNHYLAATAGDGTTAVAGSSANGEAQIQIFSSSPSRTLVGVIPYNVFVTGCSGAYLYPASVVTSLLWLTDTRLLVGLETSDANKRGLYLYDTSRSQSNPSCDDQGTIPLGTSPLQTVYHQTTYTPLGTAYKP